MAYIRHAIFGAVLSIMSVLVMGSAHAQTVDNFDHLQCYKVKTVGGKVKASVDLTPLQSQLPAEAGCEIKGPVLFCTPVEKTNVSPTPPGADPGPQDSDKLCYKLKCKKPELVPLIEVADQFGQFLLVLKKSFLLCTPAAKAPCGGTVQPQCAGKCPPGEVCSLTEEGCSCAPGSTPCCCGSGDAALCGAGDCPPPLTCQHFDGSVCMCR